MNKTNTILSHTVREQKIFAKKLLLLKQKKGKETIHDLRVAVKKLNAYLELYILLQKENDPLSFCNETLLHNTNEFFEIIGRQRDVEICIELVTGLQKENNYSCSQFILFLRALLKITRRWSASAIHQFRNREIPTMTQLLKRDRQFDNATGLNQKIEYIVHLELADLAKYFKKPHQLRKKLKSIFYWHSLIKENGKYQPELLHQILDDLGNWQDMEVLLIRIKHFRKDYLPKTFHEYEVLKKIQANIYLSKKKSLRKVIYKTKKWLKLIMISPVADYSG